jgi:hypothetical protein
VPQILRLHGFLALACGLFLNPAFAADNPEIRISNQQLDVKIYLPDPYTGFYRGTRFDWSGAIGSLVFAGHDYYGPWFTKFDPAVRDFVYKDSDIVVGPASAMTGPAEEFQNPQGYDTAKAGETFVKIGVGVLRKADDTAYSSYKAYEIVDSGKWTVNKSVDSVEFIQEVSDPKSGYGYVYRKTIQLTGNKAELVMEHSLKNTGRLPIRTNLYDHNFLVLDQLPPGPDLTITLPYDIKPTRPPDVRFGEIRGKQLAYVKNLEGQDRLTSGLQGYGPGASDYDIRIESHKAGAGMRIVGDRPLQNASLWSIRSVMAVEPFIEIAADPDNVFAWKYVYTYYILPKQ